MAFGDDLVRRIALNSESGIVVRVDHDFLNWTPLERAMFDIVAQCEVSFFNVLVRDPPSIDEDLSILTETPKEVSHHVTDLEARVFEGAVRPARRSRQRPDQAVGSWLEHAQALAHDLGQPLDPEVSAATVHIPLFAHERDARWRISDHRVDRASREVLQHLEAVALEDVPAHTEDAAAAAHISPSFRAIHSGM